MSEMYAGAVLSNDWYASTHILNSIRAATGRQCKSISALVTRSCWRRSQTRRAAAFKTRCSGARVNCGNLESVALPWSSRLDKCWHELRCHLASTRLAVEPYVDVAGGRNIFAWSTRSQLACSSQSNCTPRLRALSHASIVSWPTITLQWQ